MGHLTIGRTMPLTFKVLGQNVKVIDCSECSLSGYLSLLLKPGFGEFLTFFFYKNAQAVVSRIGPMGYILVAVHWGCCLLWLRPCVPVLHAHNWNTAALQFSVSTSCTCFSSYCQCLPCQGVSKLPVNSTCFFPVARSFLRFRSEMSIDSPASLKKKAATLFLQTRGKSLF